MNEFPLTGVGVLIIRHGKILLGQRRGSHGAGCWSAPGGHLEPGETIGQCARRETREETGLTIRTMMRGPWSEDHFAERQKTYLTVMMVAACADGEPQRREPDKCAGWQWFSPDALPAPLFAPLQTLAADNGQALHALIEQFSRYCAMSGAE